MKPCVYDTIKITSDEFDQTDESDEENNVD